MTSDLHRRGIRDYNVDTLRAIASDLSKNPMSLRQGTWEQGRLEAIRQELRNRKNKAKV